MNGTNKFTGLIQGIHRTGVQPSITSSQGLYGKGTILKVHLIKISDFQLTASRRFYLLSEFSNSTIVEVQSGYRIVASRMLWFFYDGNSFVVLIKLDHTVAFWIVYIIAKHRSTMFNGSSAA